MGDDTQAVGTGLGLRRAFGAGEPGAAANPDGVEPSRIGHPRWLVPRNRWALGRNPVGI